jgi:hypothetical protein
MVRNGHFWHGRHANRINTDARKSAGPRGPNDGPARQA